MVAHVGKRLAIFGTVALLCLIGFAPAAAQDVTPTVGDIVVDSFDCDTGVVNFHVPVTDLPRAPADVNPALGYFATATYEQGSSGFVTHGYNPAAEESPYTGDVALSLTVPLDGADAMEVASGPLQSIEISVSVGTSDGSGPTDTSRTTYDVDCGGDDEGASPPASGDGSGETVQLPSTGTGMADEGTNAAAIVTMMSGVALLLCAVALRLRRQA